MACRHKESADWVEAWVSPSRGEHPTRRSGGGPGQAKLCTVLPGPSPGPLVGGQTAQARARSVSAQLDYVGANLRPDAVRAPHGPTPGLDRGNPAMRRTPDIDNNAPLWPDRTRDGQCTSRAETQWSWRSVQPYSSRVPLGNCCCYCCCADRFCSIPRVPVPKRARHF